MQWLPSLIKHAERCIVLNGKHERLGAAAQRQYLPVSIGCPATHFRIRAVGFARINAAQAKHAIDAQGQSWVNAGAIDGQLEADGVVHSACCRYFFQRCCGLNSNQHKVNMGRSAARKTRMVTRGREAQRPAHRDGHAYTKLRRGSTAALATFNEYLIGTWRVPKGSLICANTGALASATHFRRAP